MTDFTREPQYNYLLESERSGLTQSFGLMASSTWHLDPKRLGFLLSRYKFVGRMLEGSDHVLEVGTADGFGSRVVRQYVNRLDGCDFDPVFIDNANLMADPLWPVDFFVHDMVSGPTSTVYSAAYALDVLEHVAPEDEGAFLRNLAMSVAPNGVVIVGMPSLESQDFASPASKAGHVNCKTGMDLKASLMKHFNNVFLFSMNDEVVHTGFLPLSHYLLALSAGPRR